MDLQLNYKNGRQKPLTLPDEFATKFIEFDGKKFEKQADGSYTEIGEAPHTFLHGGKSKGKATLKRGEK